MATSDLRVERAKELISAIFSDISISKEKTRELLEEIQEEIQARLETLVDD